MWRWRRVQSINCRAGAPIGGIATGSAGIRAMPPSTFSAVAIGTRVAPQSSIPLSPDGTRYTRAIVHPEDQQTCHVARVQG